MNGPLLKRTWRSYAFRLAIVCLALAGWGSVLPIVYSQFGAAFRDMIESGILPEAMTNFGGGDVFSLSGSIALGFIHPIAIILLSVFAVGFTTGAFAGERQRGTLEILLARPISRRRSYLTILVSVFGFLGLALAAYLVGSVVSASLFDVVGEIDTTRLPLVWANGLLMFGSIATIALAASVSFDRLGPALGITLAILLVAYFFEILGTLWPDAAFLQPYSLFHYLQTRDILNGQADPFAFALLGTIIVVTIVYALIVFPRRDLAAPS
ncbi:MAG TPA: ABC transporter permease subunit [Candidatus Limnocylindrales bacterium]|jgi:ABC-2 type transport system permease protein|nr:ABC transporter permease subunit [Candidatus Limnocylindrales bacterium]